MLAPRFALCALFFQIIVTTPIGAQARLAKSVKIADQAAIAETPIFKTITVPAATPITFAMDKTLATDKREKVKGEKKDPAKERYTNKGDAFYMSVAQDVLIGGIVAIPRGTRGVGEVLSVSGRRGFGKPGKIEIQLNYLELGDRQYAMDGVHFQKGKSNGGMAITGILLAGPLAGVFIKGEEADIPAGTPLIFRTKEKIAIEVPAAP